MYQSFTYQVRHDDKVTTVHGLAKAMSSYPDTISVSTKQTVVVEFQSVHEVIGDIMRNHCQHYVLYAIYCDGCDEMQKTIIKPDVKVEEAVDWLLNNLRLFDECRYSFNRNRQEGIYVLGCDPYNLSRNMPVCYRLEELK